jgi:hypothetical protein
MVETQAAKVFSADATKSVVRMSGNNAVLMTLDNS